jgi:S-DNA-T family DNA segregation ATPase FtsK/SpoIIIE
VAVVLGIRRSHVTGLLQRSSEYLRSVGDTLASVPEPEDEIAVEADTSDPRSVPQGRGLIAPLRRRSKPAKSSSTGPIPSRRSSIMRIRPDPESIPPSLRYHPTSAPTTASAPHTTSPQPETGDKKRGKADLASHPFFDRRELRRDFNAIGKLKGKKNKGVQLVERPDGRVKRFFTVESMKEAKKVGKRDKTLPPLTLLQDVELNVPDEDEVNQNVVLIENTLLEFDITVDVVDVRVGPTVTQYAVQPFQEKTTTEGDTVVERTRMSKIAALSGDLALSLSAKRLRLETPVPGHSYMGIEVPNRTPSTVALRSVYESRVIHDLLNKTKSPLMIPLGRDVAGAPVGLDLSGTPHLLISGTTGSGKSVCIAAIATALILNNTPDQIKLVMLDPKMVELSRFNGLPHLLGPVETDQERIIGVLRWCTREMDRRYKLLQEHAARNIEIFNARLGGRKRGGDYMPYIVILVDEIGDLMMSRPEETEKTITRLAQMARAVGMHLVVATQRPSVDVITGLIKANFPTRIAFAVASGVDSRVILDTIGAENLLGSGDMLYLASDASGPKRVQGCFVTDDEVRAVVNHWKTWHEAQIKAGKAQPNTWGPWERGLTRREFLAETDPMLEDAIDLVVEAGEASASMIQRRMGLGYPRAARIIDLMEELGVIGDPRPGGRSRRVLIKAGEDPFKQVIDKRTRKK